MIRVVGATCVAVALLASVACSGDDDDDKASPPTTSHRSSTSSSSTTTTTTTTPAAHLCTGPLSADSKGVVANPDLKEVSGVEVSRRNKGVLWAHNDSGAGPDVYAMGEDGANRGRFRVHSASAVDWEDIALGPGPVDGVDYLYLADIGDNASKRPDVVVYRAVEPDAPRHDGTIDDVQAMTFRYADGAHDAETLLSDPTTGDLFVVTKQWDGKASGIYQVPSGKRIGEVPAAAGQLVTGGDISPDGSTIALRTYAKVLMFPRVRGQSIADALKGTPCEAQAPAETQGEAIAFARDGRGYVTVAEGVKPHVNWFRLR